MNTNYEHLLAAVRSMRDWQRTYFKTRSPEALQRAKQAERDVDAIIEQVPAGAFAWLFAPTKGGAK